MLALWRLAHLQEAALLGVADMAASAPELPDLQGEALVHLGIDDRQRLAGLITVQFGNDGRALNIDTLAVHPDLQRRGTAKALLLAVRQRWPLCDVTVTTAIGNEPALRLYASFGFKPLRRGRMGPAALPVVQLGWTPVNG